MNKKKSGYIKQYLSEKRPGTYSAKEDVTPLGGQLMEIPNTYIIGSQSLTYGEDKDGVQLDANQDSFFRKISFSNLKRLRHVIENANPGFGIDNFDTKSSRNWILSVDHILILKEALFYQLKTERTMEGLLPEYVRSGDVDTFIKSYIDENVVNRYRFSSFELYFKEVPVSLERSWVQPRFDPKVKDKRYHHDDFNITINEKKLLINFAQLRNTGDFNIDYYFNIKFEKV